MIVLKIRKNLKEEKEIEALESENAMLHAKLDYVAMMTDVDIPVDEVENE